MKAPHHAETGGGIPGLKCESAAEAAGIRVCSAETFRERGGKDDTSRRSSFLLPGGSSCALPRTALFTTSPPSLQQEEQSPQPCGSPHVTCPPGPFLHPASDGNGLRCRPQRREGGE